ncbi:hypothetical protein BT93_G2123 [Corymbia citriodora subsp. variegata]|nr:hypothetical protein BT93_G2123 [Corymbia citriodora subsp. variegata]
MEAKEFHQYPEANFGQDDGEDSFEAEETLSLCDLPLHSYGAAHLDDFNSTENQTSSSSSSSDDDDGEEDLFEFTNQNFALPTQPASNIIFCGKLISCEEPSPQVYEVPREGQASKHNKPSSPSSRLRTISEGLKGQQRTVHTVQSPSSPKTRGSKVMPLEKYGYATRKMSSGYKATVMAYPTPKSNSYLLMYGLSKFPKEMELRESRKKHKTSPSRLHQPSNGRAIAQVRDGNQDQKGLWGVMRAISCKSYHPNSMVKTSIVSASHS